MDAAFDDFPNDDGIPAKMRDFAFSEEDFRTLCRLVKAHTGIHLSDQKRQLVYGRISRRLRALQLTSFREYCQILEQGDGAELTEFTNAITTNLTSFFRESHHFDYIRDHLLLPRLANPQGSKRIRIWCAGCSTGEEPYSLAMTVRETLKEARGWDIKILATDIDSDVLSRAMRGVYAEDRVRGIAAERRSRFFRQAEGGWAVTPELRELITFKQLNLMTPLPMKGPLDAIFCRNVVIYFDKDTQRDLFARMALLQRPNDLLLLGHSESLFKVCDAYALIGKTVYRRL